MICSLYFFFFFNDTATTEIYTLSLHDALPISPCHPLPRFVEYFRRLRWPGRSQTFFEFPVSECPKRFSERSEEHTSELQSPCNLVCRLLLEKKKKNKIE